MINKIILGLLAIVVLFTGCTKEPVELIGSSARQPSKVELSNEQMNRAKKMTARLPKLRYWDESNQRFIEYNPNSRDLIFADPDSGFEFDDPDGNNAMVFSDGTDSYLVFSSGFGVSGQGGGGTVVAGSTILNMDITICLSMQEVAEGDGMLDLFDSDNTFSDYASVIGIAGDFEALESSNEDDPDFDPFGFLEGYAAFNVIADDVSGSHEVFNWMDEENASSEDYDDMAYAVVFDFQDFSLYFSNSGTVTTSGGTMEFSGTFIGFTDLLEDVFADESSVDYEVEAEEVEGYGSMGCN
jgi:hypothetical protein